MTVRTHRAEIDNLLRRPNGPTGRWLFGRGLRVTNRSKRLCSVDTGRLRSSLHTSPPRRRGRFLTVRSGTNVKYARFVHDGHGEIRPRRAKALRFKTRGGRVVFTRRVRARKGNPFLARALREEMGR